MTDTMNSEMINYLVISYRQTQIQINESGRE